MRPPKHQKEFRGSGLSALSDGVECSPQPRESFSRGSRSSSALNTTEEIWLSARSGSQLGATISAEING